MGYLSQNTVIYPSLLPAPTHCPLLLTILPRVSSISLALFLRISQVSVCNKPSQIFLFSLLYQLTIYPIFLNYSGIHSTLLSTFSFVYLFFPTDLKSLSSELIFLHCICHNA